MRRAILLCLLAFVSLLAWCQVYQPVEHYTFSDGLSDSWVTSLYQDRNGFLWIGTANGLNRFDGEVFKHFYANYNDSTSLASHYIQKIIEDQQGNLWCATNFGISKLAVTQNSFVTYYPYADSARKTLTLQIRDIAIDKERNQMYIITDQSLLLMDLITGRIKPVEVSGADQLSSFHPFNKLSYFSDDDALYIFSEDQILKYSISKNSIVPVFRQISWNAETGSIKGIFCGIGGECWLFTEQKLFRINNAEKLSEINIPTANLGNSRIINLFQRNPEELCVVTDKSVLIYDLQTLRFKELFGYSFAYSNSLELSSFYFMNDVFWFGTNKGLFKFNYHKNLFSYFYYSLYRKLGNGPVGLCFDSDENLWMANVEGVINVIDTRFKPSPLAIKATVKLEAEINSLKFGVNQQILAATDKGLISLSVNKNKIQYSTLFPNVKIDAIYTGNADTVWFVCDRRLYPMLKGNIIDSNYIDLGTSIQGEIIDIQQAQGSLFILEKYQVSRYNLKTRSRGILSLAQLNLKVLPENICFQQIDSKELIIGTTYGSFIFYLYDFKVLPNYLDAEQMIYPVQSMILDKNDKLWFSTSRGLFSYNRTTADIRIFDQSDGLVPVQYSTRLAAMSPSGKLCFAGQNGFLTFHPDSIKNDSKPPVIQFTQVTFIGRNGQGSENLVGIDTLTVDSKSAYLLFNYTALDYWDTDRIRYKYSLSKSGEDGEWVELSTKRNFYLSGLSPGNYILRLKATNRNMEWGEYDKTLVIKVIAPILFSRVAIFFYSVIFLLLFYLIIMFTTRRLRDLNRQYKEREVIAREVEFQKEELTQKNKNITDSINYAKRIQMAMMPSTKLFKKYFPDSFILHIPKDIVSGDFYWVNEVDGRVYFAAVDCTGHGVPGAFMSIIGFELFRRITEIQKKKQPAEILNSLSQGFASIFRDIEDITLRDGMDAAFCAVDPELQLLEFAGAFNPLYLVRDNTITEIKGDRFSVGLTHAEDELPPQLFKDNVIPLQEGDVIYIFTDGYADQFGGPEGKKYKYRRFRHLLLALHQLPMDRQLEFLRRSILDWKGNLDQVDDVLVMGIRIHQKNKAS